MKYAELLQNYIEKSRLTLDEISEKISDKGLSASKQYLSKLQNGKTPPASEKLNSVLAEILDGDADKLDFFAYVEKGPDIVKTIFGNLDEDLIDSYTTTLKEIPDRSIIDGTEEFKKLGFMNYSELLNTYIRESNLNLSEIAEKLKAEGFSTDKSYLSKLQNGKIPPASEKLNVSLANILNGDATKLEFFSYVEKAPYLLKSILINLDEVKKLAEFKIGNDCESKETKSDYISNYKIKDPELNHWYQTLPLAGEKKLRKLRAIWEIIQEED